MAPEAQQAAIHRLMLTGATLDQIAKWTGVAPQDLSRVALSASVSPRNERKGIGHARAELNRGSPSPRIHRPKRRIAAQE
jgi:hypothetical protein